MTNKFWILIFFIFLKDFHVNSTSTKVKIKSFHVASELVTVQNSEHLYDRKMDTRTSLFAKNTGLYDLQFNLDNSYIISKVVITTLPQLQMKLFVGNVINGLGEINYDCDFKTKSTCKPICDQKIQNGVVASSFRLQVNLTNNWKDIYEVEVFFSNFSQPKNEITANRIVLPYNCNEEPWKLTELSTKNTKSFESDTKIYLEQLYVIDEVVIAVENSVSNVNLNLINHKGRLKDLKIVLATCAKSEAFYTCNLGQSMFASRIIVIKSEGLLKLVARGKPAFYPLLEVITDGSDENQLKLICQVKKCDQSIYSSCSDDFLKTGVAFQCLSKNLLRMPTKDSEDTNQFVIVQNNKIHPIWSNTEIKVEKSTDYKMTISMPKTYQYFGKYKCSCTVSDEYQTEVTSEESQLNEIDFVKDLGFNWMFLYTLEDDSGAEVFNVSNDMIFLPESKVPNGYLIMSTSVDSLLSNQMLKATFHIGPTETETITETNGIKQSIKAFPNLDESWYVNTYKYLIKDVFPEFLHMTTTNFTLLTKNEKKKEKRVIKMFDLNKLDKDKPLVWQKSTKKTLNFVFTFLSNKKFQLILEQVGCSGKTTDYLGIFSSHDDAKNSTDIKVKTSGKQKHVYFKRPRVLSSNYVMKIYEVDRKVKLKEITLAKQVEFDGDIPIKTRLVSLESGTKAGSVKVEVELSIFSKVIIDFISCGKVKVTIKTLNKEKQESILQKPYINFFLEMTSQSVNVSITIEIENTTVSKTLNITITNPVELAVKNVVLEPSHKPKVQWIGIDDFAYDLLSSYKVTSNTTVEACNNVVITKVFSVKKDVYAGKKNSYEIILEPMSQKYTSTLTVIVQPVFKDKIGQSKSVIKRHEVQGITKVIVSDIPKPTERKLTIIPFQNDLPCAPKGPVYNLTSLQNFQISSKSLQHIGKNEYKLTNLVPGRSYTVQAQMFYENGGSDISSESKVFENADEIIVDIKKHVARPTEQLKVTCTAEIGPKGNYAKQVLWKRFDGSPLPEGVMSKSDPKNPKVVYLTIDKVHVGHSMDYGCFVIPAAKVGGPARFTMVVNDVTVSHSEKEVDLSKPLDKPIEVDCFTLVNTDVAPLKWYTPDDKLISNDSTYDLKFVKEQSSRSRHTLIIKKATMDNMGYYKCTQMFSDKDGTAKFLLFSKGGIIITQLTKGASLVSKESKYQCKAQPQMKNQKVNWKKVDINTIGVKKNTKKIMTSSYPDPNNLLIQDLTLNNTYGLHTITCELDPPLRPNDAPLTVTHSIVLESVIEVNGPKLAVNYGSNVTLTCTAYPNKPGRKIQWVHYSKEKKMKIVKKLTDSSDGALNLNIMMTSVHYNRTGRYECQFIDKAGDDAASKMNSVELVINAVIKVTGPKVSVKSGANVTLTCSAYPDKLGRKIQWVYYTNGDKMKVVKEMNSTLPSDGVLNLNFTMTSVHANRTGRYECQFVHKISDEVVKTKQNSVELVISAVAGSVKTGNNGNSASHVFPNSPIMLLLFAIINSMLLTSASSLFLL